MTLYDSSIKVFFIGDIPHDTMLAISDMAEINAYAIHTTTDDSDNIIAVPQSKSDIGDREEIITSPPTGISVILRDADSAALTGRFVRLWEGAGLENPTIITVGGSTNALIEMLCCIVGALHSEVRNACRRNVDLRGQVALLREEVEQANIQLTEMNELLTRHDSGAHFLLWRSDADNGFISVKPGGVISQRLPLSVSAWRLGAVSIMTSSPKEQAASIRLRALEDDTTLSEWHSSVSQGVSWLHLPLARQIPNRYQLISIEVVNETENNDTFDVAVGRPMSPDEALALNGEMRDQSLAVKLWGGGRTPSDAARKRSIPATILYENLSGAVIEHAGEAWIGNASPLSRIERPPKWFAQLEKHLRVHPSTEALAAAHSTLITEAPAKGILIDFELTDRDAQVVQLCVAAIDSDGAIPSPDEIAKIADMDNEFVERFDDVNTTRWITALPATAVRNIPLMFKRPLKTFSLVLMTRVMGKSASNCNAHFENIRFIQSELNDA